jgi:murein DD-endopeptidase MepM/ murein hydrolase activator NlpD
LFSPALKPVRIYLGLAVLAAACLLGAISAQRAPGSALDELNAIQSKLDSVQSKESVTTETISGYTSRIHDLQDQIDGLQAKRQEVEARLTQVQGELDAAQARLDQLREHLKLAVVQLSDRIVTAYKRGEPDLITVALDSNGFDDLISTAPYLDRINNASADVIGRVRDLRDGVETTVNEVSAARDEIAARKDELDQAAADISSRKSELGRARSEQRKTLDGLKDRRKDLEGDLSKASDEVAKELGGLGVAGPIQDGGHGFIWPVTGPITSGFGGRNIGAGYEYHPGIDIAVPTGTGIRAAAAGTVTIAAPTGGYGNYTCIDHGGGLSTCYGHQESFAVVPGMRVSQGQIIGRSDCTGYCTGPHVHFEVRINGEVTNPLNYF